MQACQQHVSDRYISSQRLSRVPLFACAYRKHSPAMPSTMLRYLAKCASKTRLISSPRSLCVVVSAVPRHNSVMLSP